MKIEPTRAKVYTQQSTESKIDLGLSVNDLKQQILPFVDFRGIRRQLGFSVLGMALNDVTENVPPPQELCVTRFSIGIKSNSIIRNSMLHPPSGLQMR